MRVNRAILLLAGRGNRMGALTAQAPKCLLPVGGRPILTRALESLAAVGVTEIVAVVGYQEDTIRAFVAESGWRGTVRFVTNPVYATTNTVYSLWLAREYLDCECYLIEGDIVFDSNAMQRISSVSRGASVWAAVPVNPHNCTGIVLSADPGGLVDDVVLLREPEPEPRRFGFKCAGIQRLTAPLAASFSHTLDQWVKADSSGRFADLALAEAMDGHAVRLCNLDGLSWCEVDSPEDLQRSEGVFPVAPPAHA